MSKRLLFSGFLSNKNIYNLCQGYWTRIIKNAVKQETWEKRVFLKNAYEYGVKIYDANPIIFYLGITGNAVRIILYPDEEYDEKESATKSYEISAWLDTYIYDSQEYTELVITLFMTEDSISKSKKLIKCWLNNNGEDIHTLIDEII